MSAKDKIVVIDLTSSSDEEEDHKKKILFQSDDDYSDDDDECLILDYDPFESIDVSKKLTISSCQHQYDPDEITVIAERGQVACRDYPHSRHLCVRYPFQSTTHTSYCKQCYCYVCDSSAPCKLWSGPDLVGHCHASGDILYWKELRGHTLLHHCKCV